MNAVKADAEKGDTETRGTGVTIDRHPRFSVSPFSSSAFTAFIRVHPRLIRSSNRRRSATVFVRYGPTPSNSNSIARNDQGWRQLSTFEFVRRGFNSIENVVNQPRVVTFGDDFFRRSLLLKIHRQNRIELVIGRQRLIVKLPGRQFSRRPLFDDRNWNNLAVTIELPCESINLRFQNIANNRKTAVCIAVKRAVTKRQFRLVSSGQEKAPLRIRDGHQNVTAQS